MLNSKLWGLLCVVAAIVAIPLYLAIDSQWAYTNNLTIPVTIGFFIAAAMAIFFAFNAVEPGNPNEKDF